MPEDTSEFEKADDDEDTSEVDGTMLSKVLTVALDDSNISELDIALRD